MKAFALISLKSCDEKKIIDKLVELPEVQNAYVLFGEWDIIAELNVENSEELGTFMMEKIRTIPEVKLSSTLIVAK